MVALFYVLQEVVLMATIRLISMYKTKGNLLENVLQNV